ncbi:MAG: phosphoribosylglycinamide formyltransferase [Chitinophagaceae bacterium]|nr:phosphoribosylglycinamide formyltransferase [Chitinophagaceae bacterium]
MATEKIKFAVFASGAGSNTRKIIEYFKSHELGEVALVVCNNPKAGVLQIAEDAGIPSLLIEKDPFKTTGYLKELRDYGIRFIVLAGFLWKIPPVLIEAFPQRIINIHPALLPKYGGKGMYGMAVHKAVLEAGEQESGITIHYVDEHYDHGDHILQEKVGVDPQDTPESLAGKIHVLEHRYLPETIEKIIRHLIANERSKS